MLSTILLIAIAVLLVVVLLPVGIAVARKIGRDDTLPTRRPPRQQVEIPPLQSATSSAPTAQPQPEPTQMVTLPPVDAVHEPQGTTLMQWNGMLLCTSGPLQGQHFPIEENGLYIGRDPSLSSVVINDSRVSKRHLRIVPRSGKVFAVDQNSTNGTFMQGERITEVQLKRGDEIVLGDNVATFRYQI
jgi:Inner membrane component of T3SS, cytoplasmic domain